MESSSTVDVSVEQGESVVDGSAVSFHRFSYFVNHPRSDSVASSSTDAVRVMEQDEMSVVRGSTVSFHGLSYYVNGPAANRRCCSCCYTAPKQILHDVSGIFRPGLNAIMGPTGSGKTTMLDALAGRTEPSGVKGTILIDGQRPPKGFKFMTGYVIQDDVVMGTLTVRENLMFSANLRLPNSLSQKDKSQRVEEILQKLDLTSCADTRVGTQFIRGVSGGERKRTNIGMELIISPDILFLDEPTTGLDSNTATAVMSLLHRLSRRGQTVIFSLHQPRFTIFKLFDRLTLLGAGHTVFHGQASEALHFFESVGYVCEQHDNPADFFLDIINTDSTAIQSRQENEAKENSVVTEVQSTTGDAMAPVDKNLPVKFYTSTSSLAKESNVKENSVVIEVQSTADDGKMSVAKDLSAKYSASIWAKEVNEELTPILATFESAKQRGVDETTERDQYVTSFLTQLRHVSKRTILTLIRNPHASFLPSCLSIFFAVLVGIIYLQEENTYPAGLQNRTGALFFMIVNQIFASVPAVAIFIEERVVFIHECASGFYRVSTYFLAKIFCYFIPMRLIPLCFFSVIAYFMIGLQLDVAKFFIFFLTLFLATISGSAVCFIAGATFQEFAVAQLLATFIFVLMLIFGGLLVNIDALGDWLKWIQYFSITRYSLNALSINEMDGLTFYGTGVNGTTGPQFKKGSDFLTEQGIAHETEWDLWKNVLALGVISVGLMFIAYIQLRRMKKLK